MGAAKRFGGHSRKCSQGFFGNGKVGVSRVPGLLEIAFDDVEGLGGVRGRHLYDWFIAGHDRGQFFW
jgi:hypothetical protein